MDHMKKNYILTALIMLLMITGCSVKEQPKNNVTINSNEQEMNTEDRNNNENKQYRVRLIFDDKEAIIVLNDNPAVNALIAQLPMKQTFEDFNQIEKLCRLETTLPTDRIDKGLDPTIGDITLYVPWNTLVFYYDDYGYNDSLIAMGKVEHGLDNLTSMKGDFEVTLALVEESEVKHHITMLVGDERIQAELNDNETTKDFIKTLPKTITMNRYADREYYGGIPA